MKEFNLSKDVLTLTSEEGLVGERVYAEEYVKEFIRLLKEEIKNNSGCEYGLNWDVIDKLAGEKLK